MNLGSPFCAHVFNENVFIDADGEEVEAFTCGCGYTYRLTDLQKFDKLKAALEKSQANLAAHVKAMAAYSRERFSGASSASASSSPMVFNQPPAAGAPVSSTLPNGAPERIAASTPPVQKKQPVARTRVAISPQQWLIIGASILVMVAGSIFVGQGIASGMPREEFLAITGVLTLLTAMGGLKTRGFSILLSNFMASFSAVMLYFSMMNVGSLTFNTFSWNHAPAWWLAVTFAVITATSLPLARMSKNFGWKAISLLGWIGTGLAMSYGPLAEIRRDIEEFQNLDTPPLVGFSLTVLGIPLLLQLIKRFPSIEIEDGPNKQYLSELVQREGKTLWRFTQFSMLVVAILGVGKLLTNNLLSLFGASFRMQSEGLLWLALLCLVWLAAGAYSHRWTTALTATGDEQIHLGKIAWSFGTASLALIAYNLVIGVNQLWISAALAAALFAGWLALELLPGRFAVARPATWTGIVISAALWMQYTFSGPYDPGFVYMVHDGLYLLALSLIGASAGRWAKLKFNAVVNQFTSTLSLLLIVIFMHEDVLANPSAASFWFMLIIVVSTAFGVLQNALDDGRSSVIAADFRDYFNAISAGLLAFVVWMDGSAIQSTLLTNTLLLFAFTAALRVLTKRFKWLAEADTEFLIQIQGWVAQALVVACTLLTAVEAHPWQNLAPYAIGSLLVLSAYNYLFALLEKSKSLALAGLISTEIAVLMSWSNIDKALGHGWAFAAIAVLSLAIALAHRTLVSPKVMQTEIVSTILTPIAVLAIAFFAHWNSMATHFAYSVTPDAFAAATENDTWIMQGALAVLALAGFSLDRFVKPKAGWLSQASRCLGASFAILGAAPLTLISTAVGEQSVWLHVLLAGAVIAAGATMANWTRAGITWLSLSYVGFMLSAQALGALTAIWLKTDTPETYSLWYAALFAACSWLAREQLMRFRAYLVVDAPVIIAAVISLAYAVGHDATTNTNLHRAAIALGALAVHAGWRARRRDSMAWLIWTFVAGQFFALSIGRELEETTHWHTTPELYGVPAALALAAAGYIGAKHLGSLGKFVTQDAPIILVAGLSLLVALVRDPSHGNDLWRAMAALALLSALAYWNMRKVVALGWLIFGYLAGAGLALTIGRELVLATKLENAVELYSVPFVASALLGNRYLRRLREIESTVLVWGLPLAAAVLPSAFRAAASFATPFDQLGAEQVIRTILVLVVSIALLIFGVRRGNLGQTGVGLIGLMVISWVRVQGVDSGLRIESNALLLGFTLWLVLRLVKRFASTGGTSLLYVGVPVAIAMAPSIFTAWRALGNPELTSVDWWRFGVLMAASLALLTVGSLREQAGMFFPGLVGVLTTALPYGFSNIAKQSWFIWVLLLFIAAVLVWLAVRLEQLKKVGKSSTAWLKHLK